MGDALPVLYDPADPSLTEVMWSTTLWAAPMGNLTTALALVLQTVWLFLGMNLAVSILLSAVIDCCSFMLAGLALSVFYPPSRLRQFAEVEIEQEQGKSYNRQQRRWQHRLAWKKRPQGLPALEQEAKVQAPAKEDELLVTRRESLTDEERAVCAESLPPFVPRGKAARAQLLRDMLCLPAEEDEQ